MKKISLIDLKKKYVCNLFVKDLIKILMIYKKEI